MALVNPTYSNNGPAVTTSPHYLIDGDSTDGTAIAPNGGKVSFYGVTPVVQAGAITALVSTTATTADIAASVNAIITALKNVGLTA